MRTSMHACIIQNVYERFSVFFCWAWATHQQVKHLWTPTTTTTDPPPANSPTMHNRLDHQDRTKKTEIFQNPKISLKLPQKRVLSFSILAICSLTRSLQPSWFWSSAEGTSDNITQTDILTYRLNWSRGPFSEKGWQKHPKWKSLHPACWLT